MQLKGEKLALRYRKDCWLFNDLTIAVETCQILGLTGQSGCGKTSLGRVLAGYDQPEIGHVTLDGRSLPTSGYHPVQIVFQHPERAVNPRWKLQKTLSEGWNPPESLLDRLGIERNWLNRWPNELSGGELQRICIARALGQETRFLIADEMTTMLDAITQAQIWNSLLEIVKERQLGMIVISHDFDLIKKLSDDVVDWESLCIDQPALLNR